MGQAVATTDMVGLLVAVDVEVGGMVDVEVAVFVCVGSGDGVEQLPRPEMVMV